MDSNLISTDFETVVEALIFAADEPVTEEMMLDVYVEVTGRQRPTGQEVGESIERINSEYARTGRPFRIHKWAGGYRMATVPGMAPFLRVFFNESKNRRLSPSLMETLAVVAYRQPVTRPEVDFIRGVDADYAIRRLMELDLIEIVGRSESLGRPLLYGTTPRFLDQLGIGSLDELPQLRDIEELLNDPSFNRERARLFSLRIDETESETGQALQAES